ncbi:hypothetical protein ASG77_07170 [Arthrobacter sp. Soil762]|nr:hypothetical protein ASG77_07170 [Arthrobacter sp. Soil762]
MRIGPPEPFAACDNEKAIWHQIHQPTEKIFQGTLMAAVGLDVFPCVKEDDVFERPAPSALIGLPALLLTQVPGQEMGQKCEQLNEVVLVHGSIQVRAIAQEFLL